jgi:hypothetical protein
MEALKDLYSIYVNYYRAEDSKEAIAAREKAEKYFGENYSDDIEDIIAEVSYSSNEQGFIEGFRYAASLFAGGKAVSP